MEGFELLLDELEGYDNHKALTVGALKEIIGRTIKMQNDLKEELGESKTYTEEEVISLLSDFNIDVNRTSGGLGLGPAGMTRWINQHLKTKR